MENSFCSGAEPGCRQQARCLRSVGPNDLCPGKPLHAPRYGDSARRSPGIPRFRPRYVFGEAWPRLLFVPTGQRPHGWDYFLLPSPLELPMSMHNSSGGVQTNRTLTYSIWNDMGQTGDSNVVAKRSDHSFTGRNIMDAHLKTGPLGGLMTTEITVRPHRRSKGEIGDNRDG